MIRWRVCEIGRCGQRRRAIALAVGARAASGPSGGGSWQRARAATAGRRSAVRAKRRRAASARMRSPRAGAAAD
ncbi:MAG: hypothetical protein HS111_13000 [Kofleriaceae bacterium]|nr:hypothetical protein [Kofleriaceae bacterium]